MTEAKAPMSIAGLKPSTLVYWMRLGFALLAAVIFWSLGLQGTVPAIGIGILLYATSCAIVKYVLGYGEVELKGRYRFITIGIGTYVIWLIFLLVILYSCDFGLC